MSERARSLLAVGVIVVLAGFLAVAVATAPAPDSNRAEAIGSRIKCPVCAGESIAASPSGLARDMMAQVEDLVGRGYSDDQVVEEILASYGGAQLLDPPRSGITLMLWLSPVVALAAGWWLIVSRRRPRDARPASPEPVGRVEGRQA